jgi:hypothetical protein
VGFERIYFGVVGGDDGVEWDQFGASCTGVSGYNDDNIGCSGEYKPDRSIEYKKPARAKVADSDGITLSG